MEDIYDEYRVLYKFSKQPYQQQMFSCVPAEFVLDAPPPQHRDFRETNLKVSTPPLPSVEDQSLSRTQEFNNPSAYWRVTHQQMS
jgi:hypothetical protein